MRILWIIISLSLEAKICVAAEAGAWSQASPRCWGRGSDHQCWKMRHTNAGRSRQGSFLLQKGSGAPKTTRQTKDPPLWIPNAGDGLSPSHASGQGAPSSRLAHLKHMVPGRRGKEEGVAGGRNRSKTESPRFPLMEKTLCHFAQRKAGF